MNRLLARIGMLCLVMTCAGFATSEEPKPPAGAAADARPPVVLTEEARQLHRSALLIDGHNALPWQLRTKGDSGFEKLDVAKPQPTLDTDLPRLRQGGLGAQFWSAYAPV